MLGRGCRWDCLVAMLVRSRGCVLGRRRMWFEVRDELGESLLRWSVVDKTGRTFFLEGRRKREKRNPRSVCEDAAGIHNSNGRGTKLNGA